jgi:hypothetical protein
MSMLRWLRRKMGGRKSGNRTTRKRWRMGKGEVGWDVRRRPSWKTERAGGVPEDQNGA